MPIRPEFIPAVGGESRPFFENNRFATEIPLPPEWLKVINSVDKGIVRYGDSMDIDFRQRIAEAGRIRLFPDRATLRKAWQYITHESGPDDMTGAYPGKEWGTMLVRHAEHEDPASLFAHERAHALIHPNHKSVDQAGRKRTPNILHEIFAELFGARIVQHWSDKPSSFVAGYGGLGIVGDEMLREIARGNGKSGQKIFISFMCRMINGDSVDSLFEPVFGPNVMDLLHSMEPKRFEGKDWPKVAEGLGLSDAVRRLRNRDVRGNITKWIDRDYIPPAAPPLPPQPKIHVTNDRVEWIKPGTVIHIEVSGGGSTVSEIKLALDGVTQQLEDVQQGLLGVAEAHHETMRMLAGILDGSEREETQALLGELIRARDQLENVLGLLDAGGRYIQARKAGL